MKRIITLIVLILASSFIKATAMPKINIEFHKTSKQFLIKEPVKIKVILKKENENNLTHIYIPPDGLLIYKKEGIENIAKPHFCTDLFNKEINIEDGEETLLFEKNILDFGIPEHFSKIYYYFEPGEYTVQVFAYVNCLTPEDTLKADKVYTEQVSFIVNNPAGKDKEAYFLFKEAMNIFYDNPNNEDKSSEKFQYIVDRYAGSFYAFLSVLRNYSIYKNDKDKEKTIHAAKLLIDKYPNSQEVREALGVIALKCRKDPERLKKEMNDIKNKYPNSKLIQKRVDDILKKEKEGFYQKLNRNKKNNVNIK